MTTSSDPSPKSYDQKQVAQAFVAYANLLASELAVSSATRAAENAKAEYAASCKTLLKAVKLEDSDNYNAVVMRHPSNNDVIVVMTIDPVDPTSDGPKPEPHARIKWITPLS